MNTVTFPIEKTYKTEVLVVGGGVAGIAAAVTAARHGARVMLAEMNGMLGGTATAGLVGPFMTSYSVDGKTQLIRGFFDEIVRRMEAVGGAVHPSRATVGTSYTAYRTAGHQNLTAFNSECFKRTAEGMCKEAGVELLYHTMLIGAERDGERIRRALFATKAGIYAIDADVFIDASGDADLTAALGLPTVKGDGEGDVQASSLFFVVRGVDREAMDRHMYEATSMEERFYMNEIKAEREAGNYPLYRSKIMLFEGIGGEWVVNMTQIDGVDATDPEEVTRATVTGREQIDYVMRFLKKYAAGCENITLVRSASALGVRESRRVIGEYVVTKEDAINSTRFEDAVFCCSNSMDIHKKGYVEYIARKSNDPYFIPYRSLVVKGVDNLLVAGRCMSGEREVVAAIRVMPPCMAMGQAVGTAAAQAVKAGVPCRDIDTRVLCNTLREDGAYIPE